VQDQLAARDIGHACQQVVKRRDQARERSEFASVLAFGRDDLVARADNRILDLNKHRGGRRCRGRDFEDSSRALIVQILGAIGGIANSGDDERDGRGRANGFSKEILHAHHICSRVHGRKMQAAGLAGALPPQRNASPDGDQDERALIPGKPLFPSRAAALWALGAWGQGRGRSRPIGHQRRNLPPGAIPGAGPGMAGR